MTLPNIGNTPRPRAKGYGCRINNTYYRLFVTPDTPLERTNADLQAQRVDNTTDSETLSQDFGLSFSRRDFTGGEGLRLAHSINNPEIANTMFWDSSGVEAHQHSQLQRRNLTLLKDVDLVDVQTESNLHLAYDSPNGVLYMSQSQSIRRTVDPNAAVPTFTNEDPHAGQGAVDVLDLAFMSGELFVGLGASGLHKRNNVGTYSDITDAAITGVNVNKVWNVKQRILFASGNQLWELLDPATGDSDLRLTIESGYTFNDSYDVGGSILVTATDGHVYALTLDEENGVLVVGGRFSIAGEIPGALSGLDGLILLTTYQFTPNGGYIGRVWLVSVQNSSLVNRQIIREFGDEDTNHDWRIHTATTQRNHAFLGVNEDTKTHLWHYDYATTGIFRHMGNSLIDGPIIDSTIVGSRMFWTVGGEGLVRQSSSNVSSGYLITPLADNFTRDIKFWSGLILDAEGLGGVSRIKVFFSTDSSAIYSPDHPSWNEWINTNSQDTVGLINILSDVSGRYITAKIELHGDVNDTPEFNGFTILSSPGQSDIIYNLPINVSDMVTRPRHSPKTISGLGRKIHGELKSVQGQTVTLEVLDPHETIQGTIMRISEPIVHLSRRGSPMFVAQVEVRGRSVAVAGAGSVSNSSAAFGAGLFGQMLFGGAEIIEE